MSIIEVSLNKGEVNLAQPLEGLIMQTRSLEKDSGYGETLTDSCNEQPFIKHH